MAGIVVVVVLEFIVLDYANIDLQESNVAKYSLDTMHSV